ncbi:hypothetical protein QW180_22570 [Vibrio sinaloensis]|nr:hypothetical protein [Vibrio sinaloensis]
MRGEEVAVAINISSEAVELDTNALLPGIRCDLISGSAVAGVTELKTISSDVVEQVIAIKAEG